MPNENLAVVRQKGKSPTGSNPIFMRLQLLIKGVKPACTVAIYRPSLSWRNATFVLGKSFLFSTTRTAYFIGYANE